MDSSAPNAPCNGCTNNRLSARLRRLLALLAPAPLPLTVLTPLEYCLRRAEAEGRVGLDPLCE